MLGRTVEFPHQLLRGLVLHIEKAHAGAVRGERADHVGADTGGAAGD